MQSCFQVSGEVVARSERKVFAPPQEQTSFDPCAATCSITDKYLQLLALERLTAGRALRLFFLKAIVFKFIVDKMNAVFYWRCIVYSFIGLNSSFEVI